MDRRVYGLLLLFAVVVVLGAAAYLSRGYTHVARFPYDWRFYRDYNAPHVSDHTVAVVNFPAKSLYDAGYLRADCSDIRVTTADSNASPLSFAVGIPPAVYVTYSGSYTRYENSAHLSIDINGGRWKVYYPDIGSLTCNGQHVASGSVVGPGHCTYDQYTRYSRQWYQHVTVSTEYISASGSMLSGASLTFVPDLSSFCADANVVKLYVYLPSGVDTFRVWYGAVGDIEDWNVPTSLQSVARFESLPENLGEPGSASYSRYSECGMDYMGMGSRTQDWGSVLRVTRYFGGMGEEYYRGYYCHGKRFYWSETGACGYPLQGDVGRIYAWDRSRDCGRCYPDHSFTIPAYSRVSLKEHLPYFRFDFGQSSIYSREFSGSWGDSYLYVYVGPFNYYSYHGDYSGTYPDLYLECFEAGNACVAPFKSGSSFVPHYGPYVTTFNLGANWTGYHTVCFDGGLVTSKVDFYYIKSTDFAGASPVSDPVPFSTPPSVVFHVPSSVYVNQQAALSAEGNFDRVEFNVDPFGVLEGSEVTVSWSSPGVYHVAAIAYNEYNTPTWREFDVNVLRRTLSLSAEPIDTPYPDNEYRVRITVTDNLGEPVPSAQVSTDGCSSCVTADDGTCVITCVDHCAGQQTHIAHVDANDTVYIDANLPFSVEVHSREITLADFNSEITDFNAFRVSLRAVDNLGDPVVSRPFTVTVHAGDCNSPAVDSHTVYSLPGGLLRFYLSSTSPGEYCVTVMYSGDSYYVQPAPAEYVATFSSPSTAPSQESNTAVVVVTETRTALPTTVAVPVSITPASPASAVSIPVSTTYVAPLAVAVVAAIVIVWLL